MSGSFKCLSRWGSLPPQSPVLRFLHQAASSTLMRGWLLFLSSSVYFPRFGPVHLDKGESVWEEGGSWVFETPLVSRNSELYSCIEGRGPGTKSGSWLDVRSGVSRLESFVSSETCWMGRTW